MKSSITDSWPIYLTHNNSNEILLDDDVGIALENIMGEDVSDIMIKRLSKGPITRIDGKNSKYTPYLAKRPNLDISGPEGILVALHWANKGKPPILFSTNLGMCLMRILWKIRRLDLMDRFLEATTPGSVTVGVIAQLANMHYSSSLWDNGKTVLERLARKEWSKWTSDTYENSQKVGIGLSILSEVRRSILGNRLDRTEAEELDVLSCNSHYIPDDDRKTVMWVMADPYKRTDSVELNWSKFPKTVEVIKRKFPFALPDRFDLNTRTPKEIIDGMQTIFRWPENRVVMDRSMLRKLFNAHVRLMDTSQVSAEEDQADVSRNMLKYCLYLNDPMPYVKRVVKRRTKNWASKQLMYVPRYCEKELREVALYLMLNDMIEYVLFSPVTLFKD